MSNYIKKARSINIKKVFKNKVLLFTINRYLGYGVQFIRGLLVAKFLGPYYFGVWGFLMLVLQYLSYTRLGFDYAVNVELATDPNYGTEEDIQNENIQVALSGVIALSAFLIVSGLVVQISGIALFEKYSFNQYVVLLVSITGLTHIRQVLKNIHRVYGNFLQIGISELITAVIPILVIFVFKGQTLIFALLGALTLSEMVSIVILGVKTPFKIEFSFLPKRLKELLSIGLPLLIYNVSFYLIMLGGRTVISVFYSVKEMGYYSLANSITNATLLGLNAVIWVVYPNILSKTKQEESDREAARIVEKVNKLYGTAVLLVVFAMIIILPIIFLFLPDYKPVQDTLGILLMSQALISLSFGYNSLAIARKQHMRVAKIGWIAVAVVITFSLFVAYKELNFVWVAGSIFLGSLVFTLLQIKLGSRILKNSQKTTWKNIFPVGKLISILVLISGALSGFSMIGGVIGLFVFILADKESIMFLGEYIWYKADKL